MSEIGLGLILAQKARPRPRTTSATRRPKIVSLGAWNILKRKIPLLQPPVTPSTKNILF